MRDPPPTAAEQPAQSCPSCGQPLPPGAWLCLACGYDLLKGQRLSDATLASSAGAPSDDRGRATLSAETVGPVALLGVVVLIGSVGLALQYCEKERLLIAVPLLVMTLVNCLTPVVLWLMMAGALFALGRNARRRGDTIGGVCVYVGGSLGGMAGFIFADQLLGRRFHQGLLDPFVFGVPVGIALGVFAGLALAEVLWGQIGPRDRFRADVKYPLLLRLAGIAWIVAGGLFVVMGALAGVRGIFSILWGAGFFFGGMGAVRGKILAPSAILAAAVFSIFYGLLGSLGIWSSLHSVQAKRPLVAAALILYGLSVFAGGLLAFAGFFRYKHKARRKDHEGGRRST